MESIGIYNNNDDNQKCKKGTTRRTRSVCVCVLIKVVRKPRAGAFLFCARSLL